MAKKKAENQVEKDEKTLQTLSSFREIFKRTEKMVWISFIIAIAYAFIVNFIVNSVWTDFLWGIFGVLIVIGIAFVLFTYPGQWITGRIEKKIAVRYTPEILEQEMDKLEKYVPDGSVGNGFIDNYEYGFPSYDRIGSTSDYVSGVLHGIPMEFCEFSLEKKERSTDSNGDTTVDWVRVFDGTIFVLRHNLKLNSDILITQYVNFLNGTKTESQVFNEMYSVLGDDGHDIFYVLTPPYMMKLMELSEKCGKCFAIRFQHDGTLLLVVRGMNNFEIGETTSTVELKEKFREQLDYIAYILETLEVPTEAELS